MHHGKSALQQKLPKAPAFKCRKCNAPIKNVQIDSTTRMPNSIVANCTATCDGCGAKHVGTRTMGYRTGHLKFIGQAWSLGERAKPQPAEPTEEAVQAAIAVGKRRLIVGASGIAAAASTFALLYYVVA